MSGRRQSTIRTILGATVPASFKQLRYIFNCGVCKTKTDHNGLVYYTLDLSLLTLKPVQYLALLWNTATDEEQASMITDLMAIDDNMPAFPNSNNRVIFIDNHKNIPFKVNTYDFDGFNPIALVYLARQIMLYGIHSKNHNLIRRYLIKAGIHIGLL